MAAVHRRLRRTRRYRRLLQRPRVFRDRDDPLGLSDEDIFERYRFRRATIIFFVEKMSPYLQHPTKRNLPLSPILQILLFLRFLATGASHILIGDSLGVSRNTAGRAIRTVAEHIQRCFQYMVRFPTLQQAQKVMEGFRRIAGFPKVVGCVDGTFIRIKPPAVNEADYVNRKGFHSLNVQMVCDPNFRVTSLCLNWPGSTHDSRVWRSSALYRQFENGAHDGMLLGDSAYPCSRFLMTPFRNPRTQGQENYNSALCRTRVTIEQTYGILKKRFQALHVGLNTDTDRAVKYIHAAVILHNIGIQMGDVMISNDVYNLTSNDIVQVAVQDRPDGNRKRDELVRRFF